MSNARKQSDLALCRWRLLEARPWITIDAFILLVSSRIQLEYGRIVSLTRAAAAQAVNSAA